MPSPASERLREEIASRLRHDLLQPTAALRMLIHRFGENGPGADDPRLRKAMREAVDELESTVTRICFYEEIATGAVFPKIAPTAADKAVAGSVADARRRAAELGLAFSVRFPSPSPEVLVDPELLSAILSEALENAIDFTLDGAILLEAHRDSDVLTVQVVDDGVGVCDVVRDHAFQPFFAANVEAARRRTRLGIGLAYVAKAAELIGAEVELAPRPDAAGALFLLRLPLAHKEQGPSKSSDIG